MPAPTATPWFPLRTSPRGAAEGYSQTPWLPATEPPPANAPATTDDPDDSDDHAAADTAGSAALDAVTNA